MNPDYTNMDIAELMRRLQSERQELAISKYPQYELEEIARIESELNRRMPSQYPTKIVSPE